jgi:hypothetical protein
MAFGQTQIYNQPAQGVAGDRASQNPIATYDAGPGGLVADTAGVTVGNFCWVIPPTDPNGTNQIATQTRGGGNVAGFLYNDLQALDTVFLSDATLVIPQGLPVGLAVQGDFWVINNGTTEAQVGQKAYASFGTGNVSFNSSGSPTSAASSTGSTITAQTFSVTASIASDIMTVTAVGSGIVYPGATISGTGIATGTQIASQLTPLLAGETTGGIGRYYLTVSQQKTIASETIAGTYGLLTVGTLTSGTFAVGGTLTGTGVVANTQITAEGSGVGGTGTYIVNNNTAVGSSTIGMNGNTETKWVAASAGITGALVKITSWVGSTG